MQFSWWWNDGTISPYVGVIWEISEEQGECTMADSDLHYISASEAIARFKARTLSPVELMAAVIARAEAVNPKINAFTYTFFERAMDQARAAEARYGKTDGRLRALEGIPMVIKDETAIKGERTTSASLIRKDNVDTADRARFQAACAMRRRGGL